MDGLKSDSETELTSTMGNALSVTNKDEKNDTNDATPTSSTDASTASTASRIVSDDPISSTSSDIMEQTKASEMNQSVTDLLENIPSERITEDVEDLVHDLESLLGESTDSFSIPIRTPPEEPKDAEDVVSQTSGELNVAQEEQPAVSCDEETHSEDTTLTLETISICEVSEELVLSGSSTKIETDITSSETCVENVDNDIQPKQGTPEMQVEKENVKESEGEASSNICDETERPKVEIVSDLGDTIYLKHLKTVEANKRADEHVADKGDESKSGLTLEAEGEEDFSSQTCTEKNDHLEEIDSANEEDGNAAVTDEGIAKQNVSSTPELEKFHDSYQNPENKTATEDAGTSEIDETRELKEIVEASNSLEGVKITENSELSSEIPESTVETTNAIDEDTNEKVVESTQAIDEDTNEKLVEDTIDQDNKCLEVSFQPESQKKNVEVVVDTTKLTVPEIPVVPGSNIQNIMVSETLQVVPEISELTLSGFTETSIIEETGSEAEPNEDIETRIDPSPEVASKPMKVTDDNPDESTIVSVAKINDIETVSTYPNLPETIESSNSEIPEYSLDITNSVAAKCEVECQNMDYECAAPSSLSEIREITDETSCNKVMKNDLVVVEESVDETLKEVEAEEDFNEVEHIEDTENEPSTCTEQESEETVEVSNVESSEEMTNTGENNLEEAESNDTEESAVEPQKGIENQAENQECLENKTDEIFAEQNVVEESQLFESDGYKGEKCLNESNTPSTETDMPHIQAEAEVKSAVSDTAECGIPQNETIEVHQVEENLDRDITAKEIIGTESNRELQEPEKIDEKVTSILNEKEEIEVDEESVTCHEIFNDTERLEAEMKVENPIMRTDDLSSDRPVIEEVECCQAAETIIEKPEMDLKQLAESSGIIDKLKKDEKLNNNEEQEQPTSIEESTTLPIDTSLIAGNEVEETKEPEGVSEVNEESLTQPDSTETIETNIDTDEKTTVEVLEGVVENDVEDSESSEDSVDTQHDDNVQATLETVSDDECSPAESDKTTEVSRDSFEKDSNISKGESKLPVIKQLEFAPLVLSEEDSDEETAPTQVSGPKEENIAPLEINEVNEEDSEELPQIDEILEDQPVYMEPAVSAVDMQENLETILAVASLQKIDIPKFTEPELLLSEKERREMEALRRAVESITDNSADSYVEEVEELINIPMLQSNVCDQNVSSEVPVFLEAETESIFESENETIPLQKEDESVPDEEMPVEENPDADQIELVNSSVIAFKVAETVEKIDDNESEKDEKNSEDIIEPKEQNLKTLVKNDIKFPQDIEQLNVDLNTPKIEQNVSTSLEVEAASEQMNSGHDIDVSNVSSISTSEKEVEIRDDIKGITGPNQDYLNIDNTALEVDELETDENVEESNDAEASQKVDETEGIMTASDISESQERKDKQKVDEEVGTELVPDDVELQREISHSMEDMKDPEIVPEVGESQEKEDAETMDENKGIQTVPEVEELQERDTTQTMEEKEDAETVSEVGQLQEIEATQRVDEMEGTKTVSEVGESQKRETTETVDEKQVVTGTKVEESQEREDTPTLDEMEGAETDTEVGESQKREATETVDKKKATKTEVKGMPKTDATQTMEGIEDTKIVPEVGGSPEREATQTVVEVEITETVPKVGVSQEREAAETLDEMQAVTENKVAESQESEATPTLDEMERTENITETIDEKKISETEIGEMPKTEATQTVDEKKVPEEGESEESEATDTMDVKECDEIQEREVTHKTDENESTKNVPEVGELQGREATQTDGKEGIKTVPEDSKERKSTKKMGKQKVTEPDSEVVESQGSKATQEVNEEKGTEFDSDVEESQEREASQKVNDGENIEVDPEIGVSLEREATQKENQEESTSTDHDNEEAEDKEASQKEDNETDPDIEESQEREATQKVDESKIPQRRTGLRNSLPEQETLIDSSQVIPEHEATPVPTREKEVKAKANERPKRHKKSDNKLEELSINVDVPDREKPYSPKITIKPIKVPDEEVSTTSNSDAEVTKGSLKMTITKQSDKLHSVLKVCDSENPESTTDMEEPIPKLIIKPKAHQIEQQHSPKMSTRSSNQRSLSPRITIKPVIKPEKQEAVSPLKIKIGLKCEETPTKKHSSKASARSTSKQEEDSPRKVLIKPVIKPVEVNEPVVSPRITIKPIPKPEAEKDSVSRMIIKSTRKHDEENDEKERSSPKITIKPVVKPQEIDSHLEEGEEVKERIVLKINKGNLPTPTKDSKKREHPPDDEKSEKLAKITVKFSKGGGHPHIVQQMEEVHKRPHDEPVIPEKSKKQKVDAESTISTRSRHKEVAVEAPVESKSRHKEHAEGSDFKSKLKDMETPQFELTRFSKHKDLLQESPIEAKRMKLKESASDFPVRQSRRSSSRSRQKETDNAEDIQIVEPKLNSPIVISEDSRSQDSGSVILVEDSKEEFSLNLTAQSLDSPKGTPKSDSLVSTPSTTPTPRKRGRPRKVPIEVREEFKEQEEPPVKSKPKQQEEEESALQQSAQESGRPKRSCRGPSVCDRLGIKPRKPRGPGRGRGGKRGMGTRSIPMKPEKVPKLTKAKLKLMQKAAQDVAEAKKAFGKNPPDSAQIAESSNDVIIVEAEEKLSPSSETKNKSDISEPEDSKASETKKIIKSKVFKKLALQKAAGGKQKSVGEKIAEVEKRTDFEKEVTVVKKNLQEAHSTEKNPEKSTDVQKKLVKKDPHGAHSTEKNTQKSTDVQKKIVKKNPQQAHFTEINPQISTDVQKKLVKKIPQAAHSTESNPQKSTDVQEKLPNLAKSLIETEQKQGNFTETNIATEETSTEIEQNTPVIEEVLIVESSESAPSDDPAPVKTIDEDEERVSLKDDISFSGEQVSLELKKELLVAEDISLEVKAELILANETPDCVDVSIAAEENSISLEDASFKLVDKDIDIETKSVELFKDGVDVAVDVEDEIPYSICAPPGSASSKVFPGLAHGMPASVQPLLATSQKSSDPEHSSVTSTSGPSEIVMVDEETRMSADSSSRAQTPAKQMVAPADMSIEESQSSVHSTATTESGKTPSSRPSKAPRLEVQDADNNIVTAELISEYYWNGNGPFMIQEQVAQFLGIKSFKRKYPGIARRMVEMQERDFIREKGLASENMCDLGLTVVNSADILDIMYSDFQEKYEEYCKHQRDRQAKELIDRQRAMNLAASQEKNKADITEQAVQSAAQWNARFNKTRKDQRRTCMDLQTLTVHYPKGRIKQINKGTTGNYPVALVPGQFTDFYEEFTPTEINNLPLNTMCYEPVTFIPRDESEDSGSDGSESDSDSSDSSSSGSNSDSSSGVEDCKLCNKHSPKRAITPK